MTVSMETAIPIYTTCEMFFVCCRLYCCCFFFVFFRCCFFTCPFPLQLLKCICQNDPSFHHHWKCTLLIVSTIFVSEWNLIVFCQHHWQCTGLVNHAINWPADESCFTVSLTAQSFKLSVTFCGRFTNEVCIPVTYRLLSSGFRS